MFVATRLDCLCFAYELIEGVAQLRRRKEMSLRFYQVLQASIQHIVSLPNEVCFSMGLRVRSLLE